MSGGTFNYDQQHIGNIADRIEDMIDNGYCDERTLPHFKQGVDLLRLAFIYAQRIDWLVAGDDGEDTFVKGLYDDCKKLEQELVK